MTERFLGYGRQYIGEEEKNAVAEVLDSDFLTQGPKVREFEKKVCEYTGARYAVAVSSGTAALHCAVAALSLPESCSGITSTNTFLATANAMDYCNIKPLFADIDYKTRNISPKTIEPLLSEDVKLVIPVHFAGQTCRMEEIHSQAEKAGCHVIEDASHAWGSRYSDGSSAGNCRYSDMTVFSFHPVKTITCGEGGVITTNSEKLCHRMKALRNHGMIKEPSSLCYPENSAPWYYEMQFSGYNYRMSDIHAALGCVQIERSEAFAKRRKEIVNIYKNELSGIPWLKTVYENGLSETVFHLYATEMDFDEIGKTRTEVIKELKEQGIGTQVHYIPVHLQPYYRKKFGTGEDDCPSAEKYYKKALSIPLFPAMSNDDVMKVVKTVKNLKQNYPGDRQ